MFGLEADTFGVNVVIPDNDVARVMYYLNCVTVSLGLDILEDDLVDYKNYHRLSRARAAQVFQAALLFSPDEFINKLIFLDDEGDVTGTSSNEFVKFSVACSMVSLQRSVVIAGKVQSVTKVMFFKSSWLDQNYMRPMMRYSRGTTATRTTRRSDDCLIA
jgi:hypothetical protein